MRMGVHKASLAGALTAADGVVIYRPADLAWSLAEVTDSLGEKARALDSIDMIVRYVVSEVRAGDHVLIMSNGGFGGLHALLERKLSL